MAGALSSIPVLCMGIFAPLAPALARRVGARRGLAICAVLVIAFGLARLAVPGAILVLLLTFGIGLGMGLAGPIFPLVVRHEMPARPALGTGAYAIGLVLGSTVAAAVVVPLAGEGATDWRFALAVVTLSGLGSLAVWLALAPSDEVVDSTLEPPRIPWRSPVAWVLGLLFGLQSMLYYGVVTWLAAVYVDRGWSEHDSANLVALFGATTLVATTLMPLGADRIGTRRGQLIVSSLLILAGLVGIAVVPEPAVAWAIVVGAGMGAIFPIVLTLPVDVGGRPADVAATAALMLLVGYILSAIAPLAFGIARDMTGDFGLGLWLLIGLGVALVGLCLVLTPERLHRIGSAEAG